MAASSKTFRLRSSTLPARSKSCRSAIDRTAFSTWSECWANITRCRPQGAYRPKIQFLTVRSFAPVQPATNFAREFRSFSSDFKPHAGADQLRRWGWRRTRPEPIRPVEFSPAEYIEAACQRGRRRTLTQRQQRSHYPIKAASGPSSLTTNPDAEEWMSIKSCE
jgi:hypothetical protein